jgi:hypothetical protein
VKTIVMFAPIIDLCGKISRISLKRNDRREYFRTDLSELCTRDQGNHISAIADEVCKSTLRGPVNCLLPLVGPDALTENYANEPVVLTKAMAVSSLLAGAIPLLVMNVRRLPRPITSRSDTL